MILSLALVLAAQADQATVIEVRSMTPRRVAVECVVKLPELNLREEKALAAAIAAMDMGTRRHSADTMQDLLDGQRPEISQFPDHIRISLLGPRDGTSSALSILFGLTNQTGFELKSIAALEATAKERIGQGYWSRFYQAKIDGRALTIGEIEATYNKVFRRSQMVITVSGAPSTVEPTQMWQALERNWQKRTVLFREAPSLPADVDAYGPTTVGLKAPEFAWGGQGPARLLATIALGSGKGSALFHSWRQRKGWTYVQECAWLPTTSGFQPVFAGITANPANVAELEPWRAALLEEIDRWTEEDRTRALGFANGIWKNGIGFSPFLGSADRTLTTSPSDQAYLLAYWFAKTGAVFETDRFLSLLESTDLEALKATAKELVSGAEIVRIGS